ncbi:MAG: RNA polymerase sigma factor [Patescibacteria group bacterium]
MQSDFLKAYDEYADAIFRHCYFRISDREKAKDITQETFLRAWHYLTEGHTINTMRSFLYRVANNLIIDEMRKKKTVSLDKLQEEGFDPGFDERSKTEREIDAKSVAGMLENLDEPYRNVITMRYINDLSPKEIAEILKESENAISVRIHRGIQKMRLLLDGQLT